MIQDIDTQELSDNLERVIQRRTSWYTPLRCNWDITTHRNEFETARHYIYFPREIIDIAPLDDSCKDRATAARRWYRNFVSEKDDEVVSVYDFYKAWPALKSSAFRVLFTSEFLATPLETFLAAYVERGFIEGSVQLHKEVKKIDHMLFISNDMVEKFIKRTCPLLSAGIERWKLLTELREQSREVRVTKK